MKTIVEGRQMLEPAGTLRQVNSEDREAVFERTVEEHARLLYRVEHSLLRPAQDAEDAVQDALLKLYRSESGRGRGMQDERAVKVDMGIEVNFQIF